MLTTILFVLAAASSPAAAGAGPTAALAPPAAVAPAVRPIAGPICPPGQTPTLSGGSYT